MDSAQLEGPLLCVSSGLGHWLLSLVAFHQLAKIFPSVTEKDLLYAANWAVSLLQASVVTVIGIVGCMYTGFDTRATDLPVLVPYGWFNLGYWLYDLLALFHLANFDNIGQGNKDLNSNDMVKDSQSAENEKVQQPDCYHLNHTQKKNLLDHLLDDVAQLGRRLTVFVTWWPGIVAHHLGIILFMAVGVLSPTRAGQGDGLITLGLLTELSSIFVAARGLLARVGLRKSKWYLAVSICMVFTFFLARILFVPAVITLYSSQIGADPLQGFISIPLKCQMGTLAFYMLNSYWFFLMLRGCLKALNNNKID